MKKIVLTEAHMDDLVRTMPEHADEIVWILDAVMQLQKDPDADILEICRHYDLDVVASYMALEILAYNRENPIRENTFACGYVGEEPVRGRLSLQTMEIVGDALLDKE